MNRMAWRRQNTNRGVFGLEGLPVVRWITCAPRPGRWHTYPFAALLVVLFAIAGVGLASAQPNTQPITQPNTPANTQANTPPAHAAPPLRAVVTVAPLKGIIEPLLPPGSTLSVLMPPGRSEHGYEFTPSDIAALAKADLVVYVGLHLEPRVAAALREHPVQGREVICFAEAVGLLVAEGGCRQIAGAEALADAVTDLLRHPERREKMGAAGRAAIVSRRGATARTVTQILTLLS